MATRNKLSEISARMESLERTSVGFRKRMTTDFVSTITKRFEDMERSITELGNKIDDYRIQSMGLQGQIDQTNIRINQAEHKRLEEREMEAALKELAGAERPKVDKRLLEGLKK